LKTHRIEHPPELIEEAVESIGRIEDKIRSLTVEKDLPPLQRLSMNGVVGVGDAKRIARLNAAGLPADDRGVSTVKSPLEFYAFQARSRLFHWEYLAGQRFRIDFELVQDKGGVMNMERIGLYATEATERHRAEGARDRASAAVSRATDISVARLDAMMRRGQLSKQHPLSFWLCDQIIGHELWPKDVAAFLSESHQYIGPRFREALSDLAAFYRTAVVSRSRAKLQSWREGENEA